MRNGQNKHHRMRGRNRGKSHNPLTRVYESNGPDVKIRGTANHVAEKYIQLARDATASGDPVAAENYYQHAEHYFRLIAAAQEQFRQSQPFNQQRPEGGEQRSDDQNYDDGEEAMQPHSGGGEPHSPRDQQPYQQQPAQPYQQREQQSYQPREHQQNRDHQQRGNQQYRDHQQRDNQHQPRQDNQPQQAAGEGSEVSGLPSFITGGQPPQAFGQQNGYDNQPDRFPLHRRRRRGHRGPRPDMPGGQQGTSGGDGPDDTPSGQTPAGE